MGKENSKVENRWMWFYDVNADLNQNDNIEKR